MYPRSTIVSRNCCKLYHKIFHIDSPAKKFNIALLSRYITTGECTKGTLIEQVVRSGLNPLALIAQPGKQSTEPKEEDRVVYSLKVVVNSENYVKPWLTDHLLVFLLTRAF